MKLSVPSFLIVGLLFVSDLYAENTLIEAKIAVQREIQSGFTRAYSRLVLSAEQAGRVASVNGDVGDIISEGKPFACLDDVYLSLEISANQAEQDLLKADIDFFSKELERYKSLTQAKSSSLSRLDTASRNLRKAEAQFKSLTIEADILQERKQRLCIVAPHGWRVIKRFVDPGKWVHAGEAVLEVGDYRRLTASFALSMNEFQALKQQLNSNLKVILPELQIELPAKLLRVSPAFNDESRKIHFELEISGDLPERRGGLRVDLPLDVPSRAGAVLVPQNALKQRYEQYWLKYPDGTEVDVVYLGRASESKDGWVRVASPDIKPGDKFLTYDE
jgi:RND family efflux transporter MFP subunit